MRQFHFQRVYRSTLTAFIVVGLCTLLGCGESDAPRAAISGTITFDGKPIDDGTIVFSPTTNSGSQPATSAQITNGTYSLSSNFGAALGKNRVQISGRKKTGKTEQNPHDGSTIEIIVELLPETFNSKSVLSCDVREGENIVNFDLQSSGDWK